MPDLSWPELAAQGQLQAPPCLHSSLGRRVCVLWRTCACGPSKQDTRGFALLCLASQFVCAS